MADYKFTQQSGSGWKVNTSDKADAYEDCNEIRAIVDELGRLLVHSKKDGSFPEDLTSNGTLQIPASLVEVSEIGTATYDDVQDFINNTQSGGRISGGVIADDSSGGITISSGTGFIKSTTGDIGLTKFFDWSADSLVSTGLTDNSANYIYMDYNAGTPQILATADRTSIRTQDQFDLGRVYKSSGDLHILNSGLNLYNFVRLYHEHEIEVMGFQRASGGVITESTGTARALEATIGKFYLGDDPITTTAQDTSTGGSEYFTTHYYINSAWASSTGQQQIDNTNYNDITSTGLEVLTANRYGVHWAYIHFDSDLHLVYGQGNYTLAQAENASLPGDLPSMVEDFGTLAAKIILKKSSTGFTSVVTAYKTPFPVSSPANHNDLGGINDGTDYEHLTQAEKTPATNVATTGSDGLLLALTGSTSDYLLADGSCASIPGSTGGEANTASNVNTTGVGVYEGKDGIDLQFKGIRAASSNVTVTDSTGTHTISLDVAGVVYSSGAFTANAIPQISTTGGVIKASPFLVTTGDVMDFGAHSAGFTEQAVATTTGTVAIDWNDGNKALYTRSTGTVGGAATFTFTAPVKSMNLMLIVRGSAAGSTGAVTLPTVYWGNATYPTFSAGASAIDGVALYYSTGLTSYLGIGSANFSTV